MRIHLLLLKYCLRQRFEAVLAEPGSRPSWHVTMLCICNVLLAAPLPLSGSVYSEMQTNMFLCPSAAVGFKREPALSDPPLDRLLACGDW